MTAKEQLRQRAVDLVWVCIVLLLGWAVYTGYVLMGAVNATYTGNCSIVQEQALERAVEAELAKQAESTDQPSGEEQ